MKSSLKLVVVFELLVGFENIHSLFLIENVLQSTKSSLKLVAVFELFVRPAFDFLDRLKLFSSSRP